MLTVEKETQKSLKVTKQMKDEGCLGVWVTDCWTEGHGDCCVAFLTANRDKSKIFYDQMGPKQKEIRFLNKNNEIILRTQSSNNSSENYYFLQLFQLCRNCFDQIFPTFYILFKEAILTFYFRLKVIENQYPNQHDFERFGLSFDKCMIFCICHRPSEGEQAWPGNRGALIFRSNKC